MISSILVGLVVFSVVYIYNYARALLKEYGDVNKLPGPSQLQLLWQLISAKTNYETFQYISGLNKKYGSVIKLWIKPFKPTIMVADIDLTNKILMSKDHLAKTKMYDLLKPYVGDGLATTSNAELWRYTRKVCSPAFQTGTITGFIPIFEKYTDALLEELKNDIGKPVDVQSVLHLYALDVIFETMMKQQHNFQKNKNASYVNARIRYFTILTDRLYSAFLANDLIFRFTSRFKLMEEALDIVKEYTRTIVRTEGRKKQTGTKKYVIDFLVANSINEEFLNDNINSFILAGHDPMAQALCFTIYELSRHAQVQQKLFEEIVSIVGEDSNALITSGNLQLMKYLDAVIKEALRVHNVAPIIERKISYAIEFNGIHYPKGTNFTFHLAAIHNSDKYFPNPEVFNPDRFMPENIHLIPKNAFLEFSIGPRSCIAKLYAMLVIKFFVAKCLQKFELLPVENHSIKIINEIISKSITGLPVILKQKV